MSNDKMVLTKEDIDLGLQGVKDMITTMVTEKYADKKEKTLQDVIKRMARIVDIEGGKYGYSKEDIDLGKEALMNGYFLPGGSILSGLKPNTTQKSSLSNCYVMKIPSDSIEGIFQGMCEMARTYSYRGGCGVDITILRPNGEPVSNTAKHSTGAVSFMPMISSVTETIGQCLAEDSRVLTRRGLLMIKDVVVGDYAWTRIGWVLVLKIIKNKKQLYRITTKYGYSIRASKDHVFEKVEDDSFVETPVKHFTPGDEISLIGGTIDDDLPYARLTSNTFTPTQVNGVIHGGYLDVTIPIELTERLAYLVGFSYGNGSVTYTNGAPHALELAVGHAYPEVEEKLISYIKEIFGVNAPVRPGDGAVNRFPMGRHEVCSFLQENGLLKKKAEAISIPELIYVSPASVKMAFLSGYFDADGYNSGSKKGYAFSTISKKMAQEVQMLLWSMDIAATIHPENRDHLGWSTLYTVTVTGKHSQQLFINYATESLKVAQLPYVSSTDTKRTPFSPKHLRMDRSECCSKEIFEKRAPLHVARTNNNMHLVTTALVDSIVSIEEDEFGDTYDLQLADEHLFWCNGFYAHNSGRRGAALISIDITHPDIMRFIWCKADPHRVLYKDPLNKTILAKQLMPLINMLMNVTEEMSDSAKAAVQAMHRYISEDGSIGSINGANISIRTSREFMEAVRDDKPWACYFPDIDADKELYNREWNGDYEHWASVGGTLKKYTTYTACITRDNVQYFEGAVICKKDDRFNTVLTKEHIEQLLRDHGGTFYGTFEIPSAREILKNIAQASWLRGDPGILFWDHMCEWSTVYNVHEDLKFRTTNPCGELSLGWLQACNLGSYIFSKYVIDPWSGAADFDWLSLKKYSRAAVILQNIFLDINKDRHPLKAQRKSDAFARRIGIEFTAFADMLSMLNLNYGDDENTLRFVEKIMYFKAITELQTSVELAKLQGPCDALDEDINPGGRERFLAQPYVQFLLHYGSLCEEDAAHIVEMGITVDSLLRLQEDILRYGLRNTGFNCVGPTGSLSVLSNNCSSGIEPIFALSYRRRTRIGDKSEYTMCHAPLLQHLKDHQLEGPFGIDQLKKDYHIVEAHDLDYKQRIAMQSTVQRYHDGSISSTVNLPETCTPDDIMGVYMNAWYEKLKGITVYRAGSLDGVIITNKPVPSAPSVDRDKQTTVDIKDTTLARGELIKLPAQRPSITHEIMWGGVKMYAVVSMDNKGNPMELFINLPREVSINKDGVFNEDDYQSKMSMWMALTRMISMTLRLGGSVSLCMKQMKKASFAINDPMSVITRVLGHYDGTAGAKEATEHLTKSELEDSIFTSICPKCNEKAYVREAGCSICRLCNYTKCD